MTESTILRPAGGDATARGVDGWYLYGVVPSSASIPAGLGAVGSTDGQVTVIAKDGVAAVVSRLSLNRALGSRRDMLTHARVLDGLAATIPVLPARFGVVLPDPDTVVTQLLEPRHDVFVTAFEQLAGRAQFTVSARHVTEAVMLEALTQEPEIQRLRELVVAGGGRDVQFRLGELVAHTLRRTQEADAAELCNTLIPHAAAWVIRPVTEEGAVATVAFLVELEHRAQFEQAAEDLATRWAGRARVRLLGPLAPYDFADPLLSAPQ